MKTYSFPRGGISLEDPTVPRDDSRETAFLPALSVIPLARHPGGTVEALVSAGDLVREGMLVGRGRPGESANVHSPVPGRVLRVARWEDGEGRVCEGLLVRMEGSFDRLGAPEEDRFPDHMWNLMDYGELAEALEDCGIVDMEGSGGPLEPVLAAFRRHRGPKTLVARCVFDDPWLAADRVLCLERADAVVEGAFMTAAACGGGTCANGEGAAANGGGAGVLFAVTANDRKIGEALLAASAAQGLSARAIYTGCRYPQRNAREMGLALREHAKRTKTDPGLVLALGPATLAAVRDAVRYRRPILERYVAVGGSAVREPKIVRSRIGKRIGELFDECGGLVEGPLRVVSGSPFFGERVRHLDEPVTRTCHAVAAVLRTRSGGGPERGCISCGECRRVCPVALDPEEMYKRIRAFAGVGPSAHHPGFRECHGCGCCEIVCPSRLPLPDVIRGRTPGGTRV